MSETSAPVETGSPVAVVAKALATNLAVFTLKLAAGLVAGSASMMSEAAHSLVDSLTEVILLGGAWHAQRRASARYFWGLVASINMFLVGGCYAIWEGYQSIVHPTTADATIWWGFAVIAVSFGMELTSWVRAVRSLAAEKGDKSWYRLLKTTRNIEAKTVAEEDSADLTGLLLAGIGTTLWLVTGSAAWNGAASILIGLMLVAMAYELGAQNWRYLLDR